MISMGVGGTYGVTHSLSVNKLTLWGGHSLHPATYFYRSLPIFTLVLQAIEFVCIYFIRYITNRDIIHFRGDNWNHQDSGCKLGWWFSYLYSRRSNFLTKIRINCPENLTQRRIFVPGLSHKQNTFKYGQTPTLYFADLKHKSVRLYTT